MTISPPASRWSRTEVERHSLDPRQFIDFRPAVLPNGMRIVEAYNSSGLTFSLLPDRGLDIWTAACDDHPLTWISQNAPHPPDFGVPWIRQFNGGLLVTCGLTHAGHPERDEATGEWRDIHGKYSRLRAEDIRVERGWELQPGGVEAYTVRLHGVVTESALFSEQLRLERTVKLTLGVPVIEVQDTVRNLGDMPAPLMLLYHCNVGYPLVAEGTRLASPSVAVYPNSAWAGEGLDRWAEYNAPTPNLEEQVYFHHVRAEADGWAEAALLRDDFGLAFQWDTRTAPYLTQWKNTRQGIYVCGVEPGNCIPEGQTGARQSGRLQVIEPGKTTTFNLRLTALRTPADVEAARHRIETLQQQGTTVSNALYADFAAQGG